MPATGDSVQVTAIRSGFRSDPNEVEIAVVEHGDGITICAVYSSSGTEPNECAPGSGGRNRSRNNDVKVEFEVQVPAGVRFAGRMVNAAIRAEDLTSDVRAQTVGSTAASGCRPRRAPAPRP